MTIPSSSRSEAYGWLGQFPQLREWLSGDRVVKKLAAHDFTIENRKFESTISLSRDDISDNRLGVFAPFLDEMGHRTHQHPDELIFNLLSKGFESDCYDGQYYFDTDHPVLDEEGNVAQDDNGNPIVVSNMQDGEGASWFLFDTSRGIKPIIWQEREGYEFQTITEGNNYQVFMSDQYFYGIRARVNCGFGLWQLGYASKQDLTRENYAAARSSMMKLKGDKNRLLGIVPNVLVVSPEYEEKARRLLLSETGENGSSNPWKGTAELIVTPYLGG